MFLFTVFPKRPRVAHMFNHGWWWLAIGGWWRLAVGGDWPLAVAIWRLVAVGGGWRWLVVGDWWLVAIGSGWRLAVGRRRQVAAVGGWWLVVGGWWLVAVGGWWRLAVGGWWSLGAVLKGGPKQKRNEKLVPKGPPCCVLQGGEATGVRPQRAWVTVPWAPVAVTKRSPQRQGSVGVSHCLIPQDLHNAQGIRVRVGKGGVFWSKPLTLVLRSPSTTLTKGTGMSQILQMPPP